MSTEQDQQEQDLTQEQQEQVWKDLEAEDRGDDPQGAAPPAEAREHGEEEQEAPAKVAAPAAVDPRDIKPEYVSALERQINELTGIVKSSVGRIGSLQSQLSKIESVPSQAQVKAALKSSVKWEALQKDFPDFAEAVEERVSALSATPGIDPAAILNQAAAFAESKVSETHVKTAKMLASMVEPDWEQVGQSNEFHAWLETQPAETFARAVRASAEWDAAEVVKLVRSFKANGSVPEVPQRGSAPASKQRLASAAVPTGVTGARTVPEGELDGKALWDHLAKQEARANRAA